MVNPVWVGTLMFGRVPIGVRLYSARERRGPVLHQFQRGTADRIRYVRVNERTGEEVTPEEVVRGARTGIEDEYVVLEPEELEDILPAGSRTMEMHGFLPEGAVDPLWYASTYYVSPRGPADTEAYRLLHAALDRTRRVGAATVVLREREYPVLVQPHRGVLAASTLWWPDEVRDPDDVMPPVTGAEPGKGELELAQELVRALSVEWDPGDYEDSYGRRLTELVRAKARGSTFSHRPDRSEGGGEVGAIGEALRQSLPNRPHKRGRAPVPRRPATVRAEARGAAEGRRTKRELLRQASELEVPGRSRMSRDELEEAVGRAGAGRRR
ncbi:Ku protein [Nocardiopsis tropica]|uniref:Non-homologous end joining protein Ku n=1 Tax=Nocardiopsis tropica TaxID=109330 RepID=A0ABU7KTG1_9ACTN|nr:Ku protein [Nocardiopsis umidischolae]MEE2052372.1 Ku protein [Nocardiopsis umidischolae]